MSKWILALKEWNKTNPKWVVPKKNTPEYDVVIKIMKELPEQVKKEGEVIVKKTYKKKVKVPVIEVETNSELSEEEVKPVKEKKPRKKKVVEKI